jgi:hypothetical protein
MTENGEMAHDVSSDVTDSARCACWRSLFVIWQNYPPEYPLMMPVNCCVPLDAIWSACRATYSPRKASLKSFVFY